MIQGLKAFSKGADAQVCFEKLNPHFIPFTSLGCAGGLALAVTMDYLCLENQKVHKVIIRPVIAFSGKIIPFPGLSDDFASKFSRQLGGKIYMMQADITQSILSITDGFRFFQNGMETSGRNILHRRQADVLPSTT